MEVVPNGILPWVLGAIQILGICSACWARRKEGSADQGVSQAFFLACLGIVGLATIFSFSLNMGGWYLSGTTLSVMVVAATGEFRARGKELAS